MNRVRIEPMTRDDLDAVVAIDLAAFHSEHAAALGAGDDARVRRQAQLVEELDRSWARLKVARVDEHVAGYVLFWHVTDEIHLLNVAVEPAMRRHGIGTSLVEAVVAYARANAAAKILLEVRQSNTPAIALYERLGFERFNVRPRYYSDGEDGVEMMLAIAAAE